MTNLKALQGLVDSRSLEASTSPALGRCSVFSPHQEAHPLAVAALSADAPATWRTFRACRLSRKPASLRWGEARMIKATTTRGAIRESNWQLQVAKSGTLKTQPEQVVWGPLYRLATRPGCPWPRHRCPWPDFGMRKPRNHSDPG